MPKNVEKNRTTKETKSKKAKRPSQDAAWGGDDVLPAEWGYPIQKGAYDQWAEAPHERLCQDAHNGAKADA